MLPQVLQSVDLAGVQDSVGATTYSRGVQYARQHAVVRAQWVAAQDALTGIVHGRAGNFYETWAFLASTTGARPQFVEGECSCPVGFNCKHVVALLLSAVTDAQQPAANRSPAPKRPAWERALRGLIEPAASASNGAPIAVELTLTMDTRGMPSLRARLVRPGKNGNWINGGLSWTKLGTPHYSHEYRDSHVRWLRELYSLYQSGGNRPGYYSFREEKTIELAAFESRQLWPMLDEADKIGMRLVHGAKHLGALDPYANAQLYLDVTRDEDSSALETTAVVQPEGTDIDAVPLVFLGTEAHGVVYIDRAELQQDTNPKHWRLRLAKLNTPVPGQLQQMVLDNQQLNIPATETTRFRDEFYPRLRQVAPVVSSDQSFVPPTISAPTLLLRATYGDGHHLSLDWGWTYDVGDSTLHEPLHPTDAGYRDPEAERAVLAGLDLPPQRPALPGQDPNVAAHAELTDLDTMRFSTEVMPLLAGQPGLAVEVSGQPASYREAGDSLRIGLAADEITNDPDWFDLGITITVEDRAVALADVFVALNSGQTHLLLPDGAYFSLQKPELQALRTLIEEARALRDEPVDSLKISRFQAGFWAELTELGVVDRQAKTWRQQVQGLLSAEQLDPPEPPATLDALLRPYQLDGFAWLALLWRFQLGGILADDMGLGKTLQSLALMCHAKADSPGRFLIVAPTSVVSSWVSEAERFAPDLTVVPVTDTLRRRGQDLTELIDGADAVVTSYTLFRLDNAAYSELAWTGLILDEAQNVKNHQSKTYRCVRALAAGFKLAITGTPMENNLMELWSLLSITAPGLFPHPTRFLEYYARPIEKQHDTELLAQLRRRIRPLVKRRTKEQVLDELPSKQEQVLEVELHPQHRKAYQRQLQRQRQKILGLVDDLDANRFTILRSLTLLRQLSLHAGLVDDAHRNLACAKIDALLEQLSDVLGGGHRALVFSQFTGFLGYLRERLDAEGVPYCYLDGKTRNRKAVLERFKTGAAPVFLISLKAGGFGLNLTEADYCFLLDPWWNPATETQAVDRIHRIGQTRTVLVYRLIAKDTIEEKVMALKARKAELFSSVLDEDGAFSAGLTAEDIRELFA